MSASTEQDLVAAEQAGTATVVGCRPDRGPRLWNLNFFLLWQGQMVSALGDVIYGIALGFWVLEKTGSTALMGSLMAASTLPRILVSPFAGVVVDRADRKWMLVAMDALRGVAVVLVAIAAFAGALEVWMVFAAGIVISIASAFFNPAVSSALPDIVPSRSLVQANSAFALLGTGSGIVGNAAGGFLYGALGAPLAFLANGISYIVSALTEVPIKVPKVRPAVAESGFFSDLKAGFSFVLRYRGIRSLFFTAAVLNFFAVMGIMLILPLFQATPGLGSGAYGVVMAGLAGGMFAGFLLTSVVHVGYRHRFAIFISSGFVSMAVAALMPAWLNVPAMFGLAVGFGALNALTNSFLGATLQAAVPPEMRGKVFSLLGTISGGLAPLAFAAGGVLAGVLPLRVLISASFLVTLICFTPLAFSLPVRRLLQFEPGVSTIEDVR